MCVWGGGGGSYNMHRIDLWTMSITAPIPKSPGGLEVRASDW